MTAVTNLMSILRGNAFRHTSIRRSVAESTTLLRPGSFDSFQVLRVIEFGRKINQLRKTFSRCKWRVEAFGFVADRANRIDRRITDGCCELDNMASRTILM